MKKNTLSSIGHWDKNLMMGHVSGELDRLYKIFDRLNLKNISFIDIGGNVGKFYEEISKRYNVEKCIIVEASKILSEYLDSKFKDDNKVTVYNFGLSDEEGDFYFDDSWVSALEENDIDESGNNINLGLSAKTDKPGGTKFYNSNYFLENINQIPAKEIDFIKIDTENMDIQIVSSMEPYLLKNNINPIILFENNYFATGGSDEKMQEIVNNFCERCNYVKPSKSAYKSRNIFLTPNIRKENRKKITVCQFYTKNVSYGEFSEKINRKYCSDNSYQYYVEKNEDLIYSKLQGRSHTWYKPHLILDVFNMFPDSEYILFLDIDTIFCNNFRRIEEFISDENFNILMTRDHGPSLVNAGVMLVKNSEYSKRFLRDWWEICEEYPKYKTELWHDQTCIGILHEKMHDKSKFKIIPNYDFNAMYYDDNNFLFHAFALRNQRNRGIDSIYYKKFNVVPDIGCKDLNLLGEFYSSDKSYLHNYYNRFYNRIFSDSKIKCDVLEIGILDGSSLRVWKHFFEYGNVHGIDINKVDIDDDRIKTFIVDQSNENQLIEFSNKGLMYDVIIDDGSHRMRDLQITAQILFKNINPGGLLIIEDLQTSIECRMPEKRIFNWGDPDKTTCIDMLQSIIDKKPKTDYETSEWKYFYENIESIEISSDKEDSIYAIIKKKA